MTIDINFNFYSDAGGGDPDSTSPTLREYHQFLWSKPLPSGQVLELQRKNHQTYLYHNSALGEFIFGSDAITHSYKNHKRKKWLTTQVQNEVNELFNAGSNIGGYIIYPKNRISGNHTINQARGVNYLIDDRFDLTLECIKRYYSHKHSPLYDTFLRYKDFFDLFHDFSGYINFFFLQDLVDENQDLKFYLPFDDFKTPPVFSNPNDYIKYQKRVLSFVEKRNQRIDEYANSLMK